MLSDERIAELKQQYSNIFSIHMGSQEYIFREITFDEYDEALSAEDSAEAEDTLVSYALLYPEDIDFNKIPAGIISTLAEEIIERSGLGTIQGSREVMEEARAIQSGYRGLMKAFVLATMPAYTEEDLNKLTFSQMASKVALAEMIINVNQQAFGIEGEIKLALIDNEEEELKKQQQDQAFMASRNDGQAPPNDPIARKLREALEQFDAP